MGGFFYSYYAKYFAVYALFCKIGLKCEIHDCTISLFRYLFGSEAPELASEFEQSTRKTEWNFNIL